MHALTHHLPGIAIAGGLAVVALAAVQVFRARAWLFEVDQCDQCEGCDRECSFGCPGLRGEE